MGVGLENLRELMAQLDTLPAESAVVKAGNALMAEVMADVARGGPVGNALKTMLRAARDPKDPVYSNLGAMERMLAVSVVNSISKSVEG